MARWSELAEQLAHERYPALLAYANMLTAGDRATAEDITHEAFVRTFGRGRRLTSLAHAEGYAKRAILSVFLDERRSTSRRIHLAVRTAPPLTTPAPDEGVNSNENLRRMLARLTPQERACAILRYVDDLTIEATANQLGLATGTVKRYLSNASRRLSDALGTDPDTDHPTKVPVEAPGSRKQKGM